MSSSIEAVSEFATELITQGRDLLGTAVQRPTSSFSSDQFVDYEQYQEWRGSCRLLSEQLGAFGSPWEQAFSIEATNKNNTTAVKRLLGALESVRKAIASGRLVRVRELILADAFANLADQAQQLLESGYFVAAGVLFRGVLEERVRELCISNSIDIEKERPTLADYNTALYKAEVYDKITMKLVDSMAAIGNAAAHNEAGLQIDQVKQLESNLLVFLAQHGG